MLVIGFLLYALLIYVIFWTAFIIVSPVVVFCARHRCLSKNIPDVPTLWVIIPAHDAVHDIGECVMACSDSSGVCIAGIIVIADHCTDHTSKAALDAGARVVERASGIRGKTHALGWFFENHWKTLCSPYPVVITDATARVERDSLRNLVDPIILGFDVSVGTARIMDSERHWLHIGSALSLRHRALQNKCRAILGVNPLIEGRLMSFSSRYLNSYKWRLAKPPPDFDLNEHPTEDWRHGLRLAENGIKVAYAENAIVCTPLRRNVSAGTAQARRWDAGRRLNAKKLGWPSLIDAIVKRRLTQFVAALDAVQPPQIQIACVGMLLALIGLVLKDEIILSGSFLVLLAFAGYYGIHLYHFTRGRDKPSPLQIVQWLIWRISTLIKKGAD